MSDLNLLCFVIDIEVIVTKMSLSEDLFYTKCYTTCYQTYLFNLFFLSAHSFADIKNGQFFLLKNS